MTRVLSVFMEPAPYKVGLIRELRAAWPGQLDVCFIGRNLTQDWGGGPQDLNTEFLPAGNVAALRTIWRRLRSVRYDVVHVAGWGHPILAGTLLLAMKHGVPTVSDTDTHARRSQPRWKRAVKRAFYPAYFRLPKLFLPAGTQQARYLESYGVASERIRLGHMTSEVARIAAYSAKFGSEQKAQFHKSLGVMRPADTVFLFVGRLERLKGLQELIDAFLSIRSRGVNASLLICGDGSQEPFVRAAAASVRSLYFLGYLSGECVWAAYCAADVLVLPSHVEAWGLVVNEAMAAGLPVIASDAVGSVGDLVRPGETGLVVKSGSPESLCEAMLKLAGNPVARLEMGMDARRAIANWTLAEQARVMISAWRTVSA